MTITTTAQNNIILHISIVVNTQHSCDVNGELTMHIAATEDYAIVSFVAGLRCFQRQARLHSSFIIFYFTKQNSTLHVTKKRWKRGSCHRRWKHVCDASTALPVFDL